MEIKCIKKEKVVEYPKMNEVNNDKLKRCIPNKWMKLGITSFIFEVVLKNKAFATTFGQEISGDVVAVDSFPPLVNGGTTSAYMNYGIIGGTIIFFVISIIGVIITKVKLNKNKENNKIKKLHKFFIILSIISVLAFIIWQIYVHV